MAVSRKAVTEAESKLEDEIAQHLGRACGASTAAAAKEKWKRYFLEVSSPLSGLSAGRVSTREDMVRHHTAANIDADIAWYRSVAPVPKEAWVSILEWHRTFVSLTRTGHFVSYGDLATWLTGNARGARSVANTCKALNYFFLDGRRERHFVSDAVRTSGVAFSAADLWDLRRQRAAGYGDNDLTTKWLTFTAKGGAVAGIEHRPRFSSSSSSSSTSRLAREGTSSSRRSSASSSVAPPRHDAVEALVPEPRADVKDDDDDDDRTLPLPSDEDVGDPNTLALVESYERPNEGLQVDAPVADNQRAIGLHSSSSPPPPPSETTYVMHPEVKALLAECYLQHREADFLAEGAVTLDDLRFTDDAHLDSMRIPTLKKRKLLHLLHSSSS